MIFIAGCEYETISDIYVVDIKEIQTSGKGVALESMIKVNIPLISERDAAPKKEFMHQGPTILNLLQA